MSTVLEIEQAIESLPGQDFEVLASWFDEARARRVDAAFERAIHAGKFDQMAARALSDHQAGNSTPLNEFLRSA